MVTFLTAFAATPGLLSPAPENVQIQLAQQRVVGRQVQGSFTVLDVGLQAPSSRRYQYGVTGKARLTVLANQGRTLFRPTSVVDSYEVGLWATRREGRHKLALGLLAGSHARPLRFFQTTTTDASTFAAFAVRSHTTFGNNELYVGLNLGLNDKIGVTADMEVAGTIPLLPDHLDLHVGGLVSLSPLQWMHAGLRFHPSRRLEITPSARVAVPTFATSKTHLSPYLSIRYSSAGDPSENARNRQD